MRPLSAEEIAQLERVVEEAEREMELLIAQYREAYDRWCGAGGTLLIDAFGPAQKRAA